MRRLDVRFHVRFLCDMRREACSLGGCEETFPIKYREQHEKLDCRSTETRNLILKRAEELNSMISCELCSLSLRARLLNHHNLNECMFREIKCKYPDCSMIFQAREESSHYKYACKSKEIKFKYELISKGLM